MTKAISRVAERAIKAWTAKAQANSNLEEWQRKQQTLPPNGSYVVISREAGLPTDQIAHKVAADLGWQALECELLDELAEEYHTTRQLMEVMDEQPASWLEEILTCGVKSRQWSPQTFVHRVSKIIQLAGHHGQCVIVGRGAQYILPHENALFVRLIGSREYRAKSFAERDGISLEDSAKRNQVRDKQREDFIQQYFHCNVTDSHQYDLVVNVEQLGWETAAQLITSTCNSKELE